jgi:5-methylcytosine-specific restriction endonuclease McrA
MSAVLVLNATYEPLNVVPIRRAVVLLLKEKAEILEESEQRIHSAGLWLPVPRVIRLVYYVRVPRPLSIPFTRRSVMLRDQYVCQYCGCQPAKAELTIDHIVPKVRGGATNWENVVCACKPCNLRKGARTPQEANMRLAREPARPRYVAVAFFHREAPEEAWAKYLGA